MQALRKPSADTTASHGVAVRNGTAGPRLAGDDAATMSPALALRHHLTARLDELAQVPMTSAAVLAEPTIKLPMQARVTLIVGLSVSLWLGIYVAVAALI